MISIALDIRYDVHCNLKSEDVGELVGWVNTVRRWRESILNYFDNSITNGFTEACKRETKMLKQVSYGLGSVEVYWRRMTDA